MQIRAIPREFETSGSLRVSLRLRSTAARLGALSGKTASLTAPELSKRPQLAARRANEFLREQPESNFRVVDHTGVGRLGQHYGFYRG